MTVDVEIRDAPDTAAYVLGSQHKTSATERIRQIWPLFVVGLGLLATIAWTALLGWLLFRAALILLA